MANPTHCGLCGTSQGPFFHPKNQHGELMPGVCCKRCGNLNSWPLVEIELEPNPNYDAWEY